MAQKPKMLLNQVIQNNPIGFILASALIGSLINALIQETLRHVRESANPIR